MRMTFPNAALKACFAAFALALVACGGKNAEKPAPAPESAASESAAPESVAAEIKPAYGAVAMPDKYSAEAARDVLLDGGNAVDAAVAASFVLTVTLPEAGNIGGGGFMTLYVDGEPDFIDYRETAPAAASRDMYLDANGDFQPRLSQVGALASGVPGSVAGLAEAHEKYGKLPWARLLEPAIKLARDGFPVPEGLAKAIASKSQVFGEDTNFSKYYSAKEGDMLVQPELAATLQRIADNGAAEFYTGETAKMTAAYMDKIGGLITEEDLAGYKAIEREPLEAKWRGMTVLSAPPPSSGGVALMQLLLMKDTLASLFEGKAHNSPGYIHLVSEIEKRVFADRAAYLGDPDFVDNPVKELIAPDYIKRRAAEVNPDAISVTEDVKPGLHESMQTTHFSILDFDGSAVSVTTTLNASFGSGVVVEGAGYLMNDEMDDFSAKPGAPNLYGVIGGEANAIAPGKRMLSSMTPTIVLKGDDVSMVVGTPGGPTIFTSVFQAIVNHYEFGMDAEATVSAGRFHHQLLPKNMIMFEHRIENAKETAAALEAMGYNIRWVDGYGNVQAITVGEDGVVDAGADPRGRGEALVFEKPAAGE